MSTAGIHSNRGDHFQTLMALKWSIHLLQDNDCYEWMEVDSLGHFIDDIVIAKKDGGFICYQCKKNEIDHKDWTVSSLGHELVNAAEELIRNNRSKAVFSSRSPFGFLSKMADKARIYSEEEFLSNLSKKEIKSFDEISSLLVSEGNEITVYQLLARTDFEVTKSFDDEIRDLKDKLKGICSNYDNAFNVLWAAIDFGGARVGFSDDVDNRGSRLDKGKIERLLVESGSILAKSINAEDVIESFNGLSAIGRAWKRDVAGFRIENNISETIISKIKEGNKTILLSGKPGSGKTCELLSLIEILEAEYDSGGRYYPVFIQSREFAEIDNEKRASLGLDADWVERASRLADDLSLVVVIDSLDVLSISRHQDLSWFLGKIDRLAIHPNISIVVACRDFDRTYDARISARDWSFVLSIPELDWGKDVCPILNNLNISSEKIDDVTREIICNPRELALFIELAIKNCEGSFTSTQELSSKYLDAIVRSDPDMGDQAVIAIENVAHEMLKRKSLSCPARKLKVSERSEMKLRSLNIINESNSGEITFGHQTLLDFLVVSSTERNGMDLKSFILSLSITPFVRPSIRAYVSFLLSRGRGDFRKQMRAVFSAEIPFHIKRLVAESFSSVAPDSGDWSLLRSLFEAKNHLFDVVYNKSNGKEWCKFWFDNLVPYLKSIGDENALDRHFHRISEWINEDPEGVIGYWLEVAVQKGEEWQRVFGPLGIYLNKTNDTNLPLIVPLLNHLLNVPCCAGADLGRVVSRCVDLGVVKDDVLWRYISKNINNESLVKYKMDRAISAAPHSFGKKDNDFLIGRMKSSEFLLSESITSLDEWSKRHDELIGINRGGCRRVFLNCTSYEELHSRRDIRSCDDLDFLMRAIEEGVKCHAETNSGWWERFQDYLVISEEMSLVYIAIVSALHSPGNSLSVSHKILTKIDLYHSGFGYELAELLSSTYYLLNAEQQDEILTIVMEGSASSYDVSSEMAEFIRAIPASYRSSSAQSVLDRNNRINGVTVIEPKIRSYGGVVRSPFTSQVLIDASEAGILVLLRFYLGVERFSYDSLVGGQDQVGAVLKDASSKCPIKFIDFLTNNRSAIPSFFIRRIVLGVSHYARYLYGNLSHNGDWASNDEMSKPALYEFLMGEVEGYPTMWGANEKIEVLEACSDLLYNRQATERVAFQLFPYSLKYSEENVIGGESRDPVIDMLNRAGALIEGRASEVCVRSVATAVSIGIKEISLLKSSLMSFSFHSCVAVKGMIFHHLSFIIYRDHDFGDLIFDNLSREAFGAWRCAERCLHYYLVNDFPKAEIILESLSKSDNESDLEVWGRISALSCLDDDNGQFAGFLKSLVVIGSVGAWHGASTVWTHPENFFSNRKNCIEGLQLVFEQCQDVQVDTLKLFRRLLDCSERIILIPFPIFEKLFSLIEETEKSDLLGDNFYGLHDWLLKVALIDPDLSLSVLESYLTLITGMEEQHIHDFDNCLTKLLTLLFSEAEEIENEDGGRMLARVVKVQDALLLIDVHGFEEWLRAAERP